MSGLSLCQSCGRTVRGPSAPITTGKCGPCEFGTRPTKQPTVSADFACPYCGTTAAARQRNQKTCGAKACTRKHRNRLNAESKRRMRSGEAKRRDECGTVGISVEQFLAERRPAWVVDHDQQRADPWAGYSASDARGML